MVASHAVKIISPDQEQRQSVIRKPGRQRLWLTMNNILIKILVANYDGWVFYKMIRYENLIEGRVEHCTHLFIILCGD